MGRRVIIRKEERGKRLAVKERKKEEELSY